MASTTLANEEQTARLVIANFIQDLVECASFNSILGSGESVVAEAQINFERFLILAENFVLTTLSMADEIGMDKEVISVKFGYNISKVGKMIANDAINIAL